MKIAFLLYPTSKVRVDEDSSFWIMHELSRRGHAVHHFESRDLSWRDGSARAFLTRSNTDAQHGFLPALRSAKTEDLAAMDCIFIRKEPPFDGDYLSALQVLEGVKHRVFILNDPRGIALCNEKLFILSFARHIPDTCVTQNTTEAKNFIRSLKSHAVIKPLNDKAGAGIFRTHAKDENLPSLLETATVRGAQKVMIQRFVSAKKYGDKRLLVLNGNILGGFIRRPSAADFRANLSVGGRLERAAITAWDRLLVSDMAPKLLANGLFFVGIDVIGKKLTEINVTSPSGIPEIHALYRRRVEKEVADFIEKALLGFSGRKLSLR